MNQPADDQMSRQAPWLEYALAAGQRVQRQPLGEQPVKLGRSETADMQIDSPKVSREHARVVWEGGEYWVEDLGSTNGTFVNEKKIVKYELLDGDEIIIGKHSLLFSFVDKSGNPINFDETMVLDTKKQKELLKKNL